METKNTLSHEEDLRMENQLLRAKIELASGQPFFPGLLSPDLPPHIENQFLNNILKMEEAKKETNDLSIFEFIGKPVLKKEEELSDAEIKHELEEVKEHMMMNHIICDSLCPVAPRVFYKFLTEEFMEHKISNIKIPGMTSYFTYEEFHPNHEYDTKRFLERFIKIFIDDQFDNKLYEYDLKPIQNLQAIRLFRDSFFEIVDHEFEPTAFAEKENEIEITFQLAFNGITGEGQRPIPYIGEGKVLFLYENGFWDIHHIELTGV